MNAGRVVLIVSAVAVAALGIGFALVSWDAANKMAVVVSALAAVAAVGVSVWAVVRKPPTPTAVERADDGDDTVLDGPGEINLRTGTPVRTQYRHHVQRFAPSELEGRHAELAELATFCTSPATAGSYVWWRAGAWSGKTALMSWFVLHPPPAVRLVSFFVTARYAAQNDRHAFVENLSEQLLALLGREWPPSPDLSRAEANLLVLLTDAAEACRRRGEAFVLVVDGLDEDRGVHVGSDAHSIAHLLPAPPPAGMRVIVTGRPHPPIPHDVPDDHPLRDDTIVRTLEPSPRAQAIRVEMERDLKRLLEEPDGQDLLGLVTAAGGGLSAADLAELTGESRWQVGDHLRSVTGRSFSVRDSQFHPDHPVYLLGHEEIQVTAIDMLGPDRLAGYRERLHSWADRYRAEKWPPQTPEYLLRGYVQMLTATRDTARMVACATDSHRQNRLLAVSGGDAIALSEIATTHGLLATEKEPDLCAMVRLAIHRDHLTNRGSEIPTTLPAVCAALGHVNRAEWVAKSIPEPTKRIEALMAVAVETAEAGHRDRAIRLLDDGEQIAHTIAEDRELQAFALARVARAAARLGCVERAESLANTLTDHSSSHSLALAWLAEAAAQAGYTDRAERMISDVPHPPWQVVAEVGATFAAAGHFDRAERVARTVTHPYYKAKVLARVAGAVAKAGYIDRAESIAHAIGDRPEPHAEAHARMAAVVAESGDPARAGRLLREATSFIHNRTAPPTDVIEWVAEALVWAGDLDGAVRTARCRDHQPDRMKALARVATVVAETGDLDRAEHLARSLVDYDPYRAAEALARIARLAADAGDSGRAARLLNDAEHCARTIVFDGSTVDALAEIACVYAKAGDIEQAEEIARAITSSGWQAKAWAGIAAAVAKTDDLDRAERLALAIDDGGTIWRTVALGRVAAAVAKAGEFDRAEAIARTIPPADSPENLLAGVAGAVAEAGDFDRAERIAHADDFREPDTLAWAAEGVAKAGAFDRAAQLAHTITDDFHRVKALARIAGLVAEAGESARATRLLDDAEQLARTITDAHNKAYTLTWVAEGTAKDGDTARAARLLDDAEQLARTIDHTFSRAHVLTRVVEAAAASGDFDRAERVANLATPDRGERTRALVTLARHPSAPSRQRIMVDVLGTDDWRLSIDVLAELAPGTPQVILAELKTAGLI